MWNAYVVLEGGVNLNDGVYKNIWSQVEKNIVFLLLFSKKKHTVEIIFYAFKPPKKQ